MHPGAGVVLVVALAALPAVPASAQAGTGSADGPMSVERVEQGVVVTPEVSVTRVDGETGALLGGTVGWTVERRVTFGGAGYWWANAADGERLVYGGGVVEWLLTPGDAPVRFGVRGLVGGGTATLGAEVHILGGDVRFGSHRATGPGPAIYPPQRFLLRDEFLVAEPSVALKLRLMRRIGLSLGAGYRLTGRTPLLEGRLDGFTGVLGVEIDTW
ncbi:MAG: hypothetical protein FJW23_15150 [Acidimicrobiia bacterium]|nr:hypothetical protein [Acidimicrobiia bacterium]